MSSWRLVISGETTDGISPGKLIWFGTTPSTTNDVQIAVGTEEQYAVLIRPVLSPRTTLLYGYLYGGSPGIDLKDLEAFYKNNTLIILHKWTVAFPFYRFYVKNNSTSPMVSGENVGTGDGTTTSFSDTLTFTPIKPNSLTIHYTISSTAYTATDDGNGNISGTDCSGTINYETGTISLTFATAPDSGTSITADYDQKVRLKYEIWAR